MKRLFLTSSFKDTANIFEQFETERKGKTVTFIPTASKVETVTFYVNAGKKALQKAGLTIEELDLSTASGGEIAATLKNNDFIYISGGNTFFLLQELKRTGADKIIIEEINSGKLYIGESAGAIVAAPNIEYAKSMDNIKKAPDLHDFSALNLVDFYTVPHYTNTPFKKAAEKIIADYSSAIPLSPISNSEAILVDDSNIKIVKS